MGFSLSFLDFVEECVEQTLGGLAGLRMLELGDQVIRDSPSVPEATAKEFFRNRGVHHVSFDLNGCHGALEVDIGRPIENPDWLGTFDIVTNSGTSEHIEPFEAQYVCFLNIHDCLRAGGISVHIVPDIVELEERGLWKNHCNYYYSHEFFATLADLNDYDLLSSKIMDGLRCVCLRKRTDAPFTPDRKTVLAGIARREGGFQYDYHLSSS
jgi:hypothetical protein